jgi:hypothetical protein
MALFTSEPEPLPIPRSAAHLLPAATLVGVLAEASIIIGLPWGRWGDDAELRFDWLATWGAALHNDTATTLLAFVAAVLVLYGMSIGGQSTFQKRIDRDTTRRSAGVLGILVAVSAMALFIFAVSAAVSNPKLWPSLVVIVPTTIICWYLGIEVGRYVVPDLRQQLRTAQQQEVTLKQRREALPEDRAEGAWTASVIAIRALVFAVLAMAAVAATMQPRDWGVVLAAGGIALVGSGVALMLYALLAASTLVEPARWKRVLTVLGAAFLYLLTAVLFIGSMIVVAPTAWAGIAALLLLSFTGPVAFHWKQPRSGTPPAKRTLRAAMAGIESHSLKRTSTAVAKRLEELEDRAYPVRTRVKRLLMGHRSTTSDEP